ncbi:MAG: phosphate acyltransferase [Gemmatimonadota bacterium]|nr:phosphate acyltransferase [Gemmatimonadota bacterium]
MSFRRHVRSQAAAHRCTVVLAEGWDDRVRRAADILETDGIATVVLLDRSMEGDPRQNSVAELLAVRRPDAVRNAAHARELAADPLRFAAALVGLGEADAAVAGATCPTSDVIRAALWAIGPAAGIATVSSAFYLDFPVEGFSFRSGECGTVEGENGVGDTVLTFADAGVVPDPTADQLAEIAWSAAHDRRLVVGDEPVVAFLSYSTRGSADGPRVEKMREAVERFRVLAPDIVADGELQGDAALVPDIARLKAPDSHVAGCANIMVFPDLDSGNVTYKLVQRLAGATATGPILQGLARPMIDLSRGATADDVVDGAAVGILQAASPNAGSIVEEA